MPGLSRASTPPCRAWTQPNSVDGRDEPGQDASGMTPIFEKNSLA